MQFGREVRILLETSIVYGGFLSRRVSERPFFIPCLRAYTSVIDSQPQSASGEWLEFVRWLFRRQLGKKITERFFGIFADVVL